MRWEQTLLIGVLLLFLLLTFFPFVYLLYGSLKSVIQWRHEPLLPTWPLHFGNYSAAWTVVAPYIRNSLFVSVVTLAGVLFVSCLSGWVFARFRFPGRELLFMMILGLMMIPGILTLVSRFVVAFRLGLYDSLWGLIWFYIAGGQVMAIFILRSFFSNLPEELFEAARMDGSTEAQNLLMIGLPLSKSMLLTVGIMNFLGTWNDFVWPYLLIRSEPNRTITIGMVAFGSTHLTSYGGMFAGYVLCSLPLLILFVLTSRYYIAGLMSGAIKL
jgi:ABC-type glycerol-3-phosphate transport system permease component